MQHVSLRIGAVLLSVICAAGTSACSKQGGKKKQSSAALWVDEPAEGQRDGDVITIDGLGVRFEVPDTLYVFRNCDEASHSPEGESGWVPVIRCRSTGGGGGGDELGEEGGGDEEIALTIYATHLTRPLDERTVTWFENQFKQAGLDVDEISYQHDFQKKSGIYAKLQVMNSEGLPEREITRFMFPSKDIVFIAEMQVPFGETRSIQPDWKYILWNFDVAEPAPKK